MVKPQTDVQVLGVSANATEAEIKKAYRSAMFNLHPDQVQNRLRASGVTDTNVIAQKQAETAKKFARIQKAHSNLTENSGSGKVPPTTGASTTRAAPGTAEVRPYSKWRASVSNVRSKAQSMKLPKVIGRAGAGLSAYHLYNQFFDENSTYRRDVQFEPTKQSANIALALDATAFTVYASRPVSQMVSGLGQGVSGNLSILARGFNGQARLGTGTAVKLLNPGTTSTALAKTTTSVAKYTQLAKLSNASAKMARFSKVSRAAGPIGTVLTVAASGFEYDVASKMQDGKRAASAIGAGGGALAGAATGATIGSVVPVIGTAIGGIVGGLIGAFGGGYAGGKYYGDDLQERFDEKALKQQQKNLDKLSNIEEKMKVLEVLQNDYALAIEQYNAVFEGKDTAAITAAQKHLTQSLEDLSAGIETYALTKNDQRVLNEVGAFTAEQAAFLDKKEQNLINAGDEAALERLRNSREANTNAQVLIAGMREFNAGVVGAGKEIPKAISTINQESTQRIAEIEEQIKRERQAAEQKEFAQSVVNETQKINNAFNDGQANADSLAQITALMDLVESGDIDASVLAEAKAAIEANNTKRTAEQQTMESSRSILQKKIEEQRTKLNKTPYAQANIEELTKLDEQMAVMLATYDETDAKIQNAMKQAEVAVAINEHVRDLESSIPDIDVDAVQSAATARTDLQNVFDTDVIDLDKLESLQNTAHEQLHALDGASDVVSDYAERVNKTLHEGVSVNGNMKTVTRDHNTEDLNALKEEASLIDAQYSAASDNLKTQMTATEKLMESRVIKLDNGTVVQLDQRGAVSSYTVNGQTMQFKNSERPMLVDYNDPKRGTVFNSALGQYDTSITLALYNDNGVVTKVGESYQADKDADKKQRKDAFKEVKRLTSSGSQRRALRKEHRITRRHEKALAKALEDDDIETGIAINDLRENMDDVNRLASTSKENKSVPTVKPSKTLPPA
jgi:curved DNA-binding protein CbpA